MLLIIAFNNFCTSPVNNENARLRLVLVIPIGTPITVAKDSVVTDKTI